MKKHPFKDYILAVRPWSFPASSMTALVIFAFVFFEYKTNSKYADINWFYGIISIVASLICQASGNLISDYFDYKNGVDREDTHGTNRMLIDKVFKPESFLISGIILLIIVSLIGLYVFLNTGIYLIYIGLTGILGAIFYFWFKYHALGDIIIFLIYGPLIAIGTSFCMTNSIVPNAIYISLPIAFFVANILHANNTNDMITDKRAGIKTIPILIGFRASQKLYTANTIIAYTVTIILIILKILPVWSLIALITLFIAKRNINIINKATINKKNALLGLDGASAQLVMIFDTAIILSLIIAA